MKNALMAVAALAMLVGSAAAAEVAPAANVAPPKTKAASRTVQWCSPWGHRSGPGWSFAHVKRMAKKRRNQLRNRRAHGGRA